MRPAVHNGPSALLEREPGGEQRAEHVGVGVDVTEHQRTTRSATERAEEIRRRRERHRDSSVPGRALSSA